MKVKMKMWKLMIAIMKNNNKNNFVFNVVLCCFLDNLVHHYDVCGNINDCLVDIYIILCCL